MTTTALAETHYTNDAIMEYVRTGDVSAMNNKQKNEIIIGMCKHLGIDPAMKPIDIIPSSAGEKLYLNSTGTDMIAKQHNLSREVEELEFKFDNTIAILRSRVTDGKRVEKGYAAITIGKFEGGKLVAQRGEELANTLMKLQTKALRRATLAFAGAADIGLNTDIVENRIEVVPQQPIAVAQAQQKPAIQAPAFLSGSAVPADIVEPVKPNSVPIQKPIEEDELVVEADVSEDDIADTIDYDAMAKALIKERYKTQKEFKEQTGYTLAHLKKWLESGKTFEEMSDEEPATKEEEKQTKQQEKIAQGNVLAEKNDALAAEIKDKYAFDLGEASIFEDKKPKVIEYDLFDGKNPIHLKIFLAVIAQEFGENWKVERPMLKEVLQTKVMPAFHKRALFLVKGTEELFEGFVDNIHKELDK